MSEIICRKHIDFHQTPNPGRKTKAWTIKTKEGQALGTVRWYSHWRRYCFMPLPHTVFEEQCLTDIIDFMKDQTNRHRHAAWAARQK